jgi:hypothetical protein
MNDKCFHVRSESVILTCVLTCVQVILGTRYPGGNPGANLKSISHTCYLRDLSFEWVLSKETIYFSLGCLQGGVSARGREGGRCVRERASERDRSPSEMNESVFERKESMTLITDRVRRGHHVFFSAKALQDQF